MFMLNSLLLKFKSSGSSGVLTDVILREELETLTKKQVGEEIAQDVATGELYQKIITREGFEEYSESQFKRVFRTFLTRNGGWKAVWKEAGEGLASREVAQGWFKTGAGRVFSSSLTFINEKVLGTRLGRLLTGVGVLIPFGGWIARTIGGLIGAGADGLRDGWCADAPDPEKCAEDFVNSVGAFGFGAIGIIVAGLGIVVLLK